MHTKQLDKQTDALERKMLDVKPWYLQGEVAATRRNENTLLEEHFDVQRHGLFSKFNAIHSKISLEPDVHDEAAINDYIIKAIKERVSEILSSDFLSRCLTVLFSKLRKLKGLLRKSHYKMLFRSHW